MGKHEPTPEERAEYIVKRLEMFIREKREPFKGMNFNKWQQLARAEIANAMKDYQKTQYDENQVTRRMLFILGSTIATIGFWGVAAAFGKIDYMLAGMICLIAGIIVIAHAGEWMTRKMWKKAQARKRERAYNNAISLDRQIKQMEKELKGKAKDLEKTVAAMGRAVPSLPNKK
ncbi:conserved hypothetical protein [Candidatus Terasakiella magnetica]|uniref:DUF4231 domain-containing protein n=1 Tax=Candidatus Terasakiella magnetica TaxID=1867952 RepID=A0A1C3RCC4_9PROT|nr:hypothetical protein [Candidatus Terasakiella magnetica]SCA54915.1 conserved hypothetical protein [Candidatus Terasakiella magnetica]